MGCYLTEYRARVGIWAVRFSHVSKTSQRAAQEQGRQEVIVSLGTMILSAATLAMLLVIGGVETNPGPVRETEIMWVLRSGCDKILKSGTLCETCGRWFHNSCGKVCGKFVLLRVENRLAINAERRDLEYWKRNCRTHYIKLTR